jgi:uracil-DNA glycosylase
MACLKIENYLKEPSWLNVLKEEFKKPYFKKINEKIFNEIKMGNIVVPEIERIFHAFNTTPLDKVKVVIIGQDPYPKEGVSDGLGFSSKEIQPSLKNIFMELKMEYTNFITPDNGTLINWAKQGVLLLNSILTVNVGKPKSHSNFGWITFTNKVIQILNEKESPVIFLLLGSVAKDKNKYITSLHHSVITGGHPSPLNNTFLGGDYFKRINEILKKRNDEEIKWW